MTLAASIDEPDGQNYFRLRRIPLQLLRNNADFCFVHLCVQPLHRWGSGWGQDGPVGVTAEKPGCCGVAGHLIKHGSSNLLQLWDTLFYLTGRH